MKEAHEMMIDSLKLQMETFNKELNQIRNTRYRKERVKMYFIKFSFFSISKQKEREALLKTIEQTKLTSKNNDIRHNRFVTQTTAKVTDLSERVSLILIRFFYINLYNFSIESNS